MISSLPAKVICLVGYVLQLLTGVPVSFNLSININSKSHKIVTSKEDRIDVIDTTQKIDTVDSYNLIFIGF